MGMDAYFVGHAKGDSLAQSRPTSKPTWKHGVLEHHNQVIQYIEISAFCTKAMALV